MYHVKRRRDKIGTFVAETNWLTEFSQKNRWADTMGSYTVAIQLLTRPFLGSQRLILTRMQFSCSTLPRYVGDTGGSAVDCANEVA